MCPAVVSILAPEDRQEGVEAVFEIWADPRPEPRIVKVNDLM
jgi:hypothetical protein